ELTDDIRQGRIPVILEVWRRDHAFAYLWMHYAVCPNPIERWPAPHEKRLAQVRAELGHLRASLRVLDDTPLLCAQTKIQRLVQSVPSRERPRTADRGIDQILDHA